MANIVRAIYNIKTKYDNNIENIVAGSNRMNNMGEGLETYIQNAFASIVEGDDTLTIKTKNASVFSYLGSKNNPPDMMIKSGDAIEVKKIQSTSSNLQLNSSHPKDKLHSTNSKINQACVDAEDWTKKDIIYAVGTVPAGKKILHSLWFVMGDCYAANPETYTRLENTISSSILKLPGIEVNEDTNELSGIKNVDPLLITNLRVRGMWIIRHPSKVFDYAYTYKDGAVFQMVAIMKKDKYEQYPIADRNLIESDNDINIEDVNIRDPNNTAKWLSAKLITYFEI
jgi:hypothetical protein